MLSLLTQKTQITNSEKIPFPQHGYLRFKTISKPSMADNRAVAQFVQEQLEWYDSIYMAAGSDPLNENEAEASPDREKWIEAMRQEIKELLDLDCWHYVDASELPPGAQLFKGKFVYKCKPPQNGMDWRYKARWCIAQPKFLQRVTDEETFAETVRVETIQHQLATAIQRNWTMCEFDVCNAFATSKLEKPVYMAVPKFMQSQYPGKICKVTGALYGLCVSPKTFHQHLHKWFMANNFEAASADKCLYLKRNSAGEVILSISSWVDDGLMAGTDEAIEEFKALFQKTFKIRDFGEPQDFIGCEIHRDVKAGICRFTQTKYIEKMAKRYNISTPTSSAALSPLDYTLKLEPAAQDEERIDPTEYRSIVGAMHYAAHCTRPDISASIAILSKFLNDPSMRHMRQAQKTLTYLMATKDFGLVYRRHVGSYGPTVASLRPGVISGFADATFADDPGSRRSHSGYVFLLNNAAISWSSRQQDRVAKSSGEAEFRAFDSAGREALWLRKLEWDYMNSEQRALTHPPTRIWEDNKSCIKWLNNHCLHQKTKHIETIVLSIREQILQYKTLDTDHVTTTSQLADVFTKSLPPKHHWSLARYVLGVQIPASCNPGI